jgi:hypothetical protein
MMIPKSDTRSGTRSPRPAPSAAPTAPTARARRSRATGTALDQRRDAQPREDNRRARDTTTTTRAATASRPPDPWLACTKPRQTAASDYASQSLVNWLQPAILIAQHQTQWFEESNRAFAAWCAWWQASFGIPPAAAPLAGGVSAWWWACHRALPFAGIG